MIEFEDRVARDGDRVRDRVGGSCAEEQLQRRARAEGERAAIAKIGVVGNRQRGAGAGDGDAAGEGIAHAVELDIAAAGGDHAAYARAGAGSDLVADRAGDNHLVTRCRIEGDRSRALYRDAIDRGAAAELERAGVDQVAEGDDRIVLDLQRSVDRQIAEIACGIALDVERTARADRAQALVDLNLADAIKGLQLRAAAAEGQSGVEGRDELVETKLEDRARADVVGAAGQLTV